LIDKDDVDSFLEFVDNCRLKVFEARLQGFARAGPCGMNVNDEEFSIVFVEVGLEVL
jgi:hypothetical protein